MNDKATNDQFLLERLKKGDEKAFRSIYEKYWEGLFSVAYHWVRSKETSKELLQDLFTQLWEKRESLHIRKSFRAYLFTALKYKVYNYLDAEEVRNRHMIQMKRQTVHTEITPEELLNYRETKAVLEKAVKALPVKTRKIFVLSRYHHYSIEEIAKKMHLSPKAVEYHITKSLKQLKYAIKGILLLLVIILISFFNF